MSSAADWHTADQVARERQLPLDDPTGDRTRAACQAVMWRRWQEQHRGDWQSGRFREFMRDLWGQCRSAANDDPAAAAVVLAQRVVRRVGGGASSNT